MDKLRAFVDKLINLQFNKEQIIWLAKQLTASQRQICSVRSAVFDLLL